MSRDRQAAEAVVMGMTYEQAAAEFGFCDKAAAYRAVAKILAENTVLAGSVQERRARQLEELRLAQAEAWKLILSPPAAISRTGRLVTREDGSEVADAGAVVAAIALVGRLSEVESKLTGTLAPRRSISLSGDADVATVLAFLDALPPGVLSAALEERRRQIAEAETRAVPGAVED